jgi:hypothetical protein
MSSQQVNKTGVGSGAVGAGSAGGAGGAGGAGAGAGGTGGAGGGSADPFPCQAILVQSAKFAIEQDRPVLFDYYVDTATNKACMMEDTESKNKILFKSRDEYTSYVQKVYKVADDYMILTENSIYIVSGKITKRRVNLKQITGDDDEDIPVSN